MSNISDDGFGAVTLNVVNGVLQYAIGSIQWRLNEQYAGLFSDVVENGGLKHTMSKAVGGGRTFTESLPLVLPLPFGEELPLTVAGSNKEWEIHIGTEVVMQSRIKLCFFAGELTCPYTTFERLPWDAVMFPGGAWLDHGQDAPLNGDDLTQALKENDACVLIIDRKEQKMYRFQPAATFHSQKEGKFQRV